MRENQHTRYGAIARTLPFTPGKIFFVLNSSDAWYADFQSEFPADQDGVERVYSSVSSAYDATVTGRNDVVVLDSYSAHAITSMGTISKDRVHFIGLPIGAGRITGQRSRITMGVTTAVTDIAMIKVTGNGCTFRYIKFYSTNTLAQHLYGIISAGESTIWENCCFEMNNKTTTANMAEVLEQGTNNLFIRCSMAGDSYYCDARPNLLFDASVGNASVGDGSEFRQCRFTRWSSLAANPQIKVAAATGIVNYAIFDDCIFSAKIAEGATAITDVLVQGASLTQGYMLFKNPALVGITNIYTNGGKTGAFTNASASGATGGKPTQCNSS